MKKSIGGYFELEIDIKNKLDFHSNLIALNTARNCFEYILLVKKYNLIYIPYFTCDVLLEPLYKHNVLFKFYDVNDNLEPIIDYKNIQEDEAVLLTNYFGIKSEFIERIVHKNVNFIVDNSQAYFARPLNGIDTFYSPRKFVGVADGGYLSTNCYSKDEFEIDYSFERVSHLIKRIEFGAEFGYEDFKNNDISLENQPIKKMSLFTSRILKGLDYDYIIDARKKNFKYLHEYLKHTNKSDLTLSDLDVPMIYPYRIENTDEARNILLKDNIFCATYWPNVLRWCSKKMNAYHLTKEIIPLPIDHRYGRYEMDKIIKLLN